MLQTKHWTAVLSLQISQNSAVVFSDPKLENWSEAWNRHLDQVLSLHSVWNLTLVLWSFKIQRGKKQTKKNSMQHLPLVAVGTCMARRWKSLEGQNLWPVLSASASQHLDAGLCLRELYISAGFPWMPNNYTVTCFYPPGLISAGHGSIRHGWQLWYGRTCSQ